MDSRTTWALDSGFLSYLDSGFHCLDSGFQDSGFRIPKPTKSRIPDSGLPHKGRTLNDSQQESNPQPLR